MAVKTIQMTIDDTLLGDVDSIVRSLGTSRSAFIREALEMALHRYQIRILEERHAAAYRAVPQDPEEIDEWVGARAWGEE